MKVHCVEKWQEVSEADCASLGLAWRNCNPKKKKFYSEEMFAMFEFYFLLVKLNNQITEQNKSGVLETIRI